MEQTTLEKIEWLDKNLEKVRAIFTEPVIEGVKQGLWDIFNKEEQEAKEDLTDEQVEFNRQAILNK